MSTSDRPPREAKENDSAKEFQLSPTWVVLGLVAIAIGVGCGLIMSSATFLR